MGANPGKTVSAAAMKAAMAKAESALIMTVPCHSGFDGPLAKKTPGGRKRFIPGEKFNCRIPAFGREPSLLAALRGAG
jgi:hypothetical protein